MWNRFQIVNYDVICKRWVAKFWKEMLIFRSLIETDEITLYKSTKVKRFLRETSVALFF